MTLRAVIVAGLMLIGGHAIAASPGARAVPVERLAPPIVFYVARGAPDGCGRGCDSWIAAEGQIDSDAAPRFRKFLRQIRGRNLPIYFASPGGNIDQALAIGAILRERPVVARVARTVVSECGFEAQDSDVCLKLKHSGRELHGDLWTRAAMCNSACPYLILGASTREIAPDAVLAIHSPKVVLRFSGGAPTPQARAAATERSLARIDRTLSSYIARMGARIGLLELARTVPFEGMHILTREEIVRFGIDRRDIVDTPWTFENNGRSMVRKFAIDKGAADNSYRLLQWRLVCFNAERFELDFQRPAGVYANLATVSISDGGTRYFSYPPARSQAFEAWGLRLNWESVQALADQLDFEFTETSFGLDGKRVAHPERFSTEGLTGALASLLATCPPRKDGGPVPTNVSRDRAAN
jgi:hypothetical protein